MCVCKEGQGILLYLIIRYTVLYLSYLDSMMRSNHVKKKAYLYDQLVIIPARHQRFCMRFFISYRDAQGTHLASPTASPTKILALCNGLGLHYFGWV